MVTLNNLHLRKALSETWKADIYREILAFLRFSNFFFFARFLGGDVYAVALINDL